MCTDRWRGAVLPAFTLVVVSALPWMLHAQEASETGLPLEPARWARFTASEGTWISLDVSPDGQTIVFDLLGDLYAIPIDGGSATRLTHGIAHDMQPRFSTDGHEIVFVSDRSGDDNVWLMAADGSDIRPLTKGVAAAYVSPEWTPDGDYIVVSRQAPLQGLEKLWLYHKRGGIGLNMTPGPGAVRTLGPAFGSDGRYVWYGRRSGAWSYNAVLPQYQIGVYDRCRYPHHDELSLRLGVPTGAFARRQMADLRLAPRFRDGPGAP